MFKECTKTHLTRLAAIVAGFLFWPAIAFANQCLTISCDCASLDSANDRAMCQQQEVQLIKDCELAGGLTGYCQIAGLQGAPMPFSLTRSDTLSPSEEAIEISLDQIEAFYWSVNQDLEGSQRYIESSAYGNALTVYKNLSTTLDRIYGIQRQAYDSWRALDDKDEAEDVASDAYEDMAALGETLYLRARGLWAERTESDAKLQRKRQILAMKVLRYAGSAYQQAAELAALAKERELAARLWQSSAETAEVMLSWRQQANSKAQYINYYRQQSVASWYRSALYWERIEEPEQAEIAREKALQLTKSQVAQR